MRKSTKRHLTPTEKLIDKLMGMGYEVRFITPVAGYWKSQDVYRWEGQAYHFESRSVVSIASWEPVKDCARFPLVATNHLGTFEFDCDRTPKCPK